MKFTQEGKIWIEVQQECQFQKIYKISVNDTGVGMKIEEQQILRSMLKENNTS